MNSCRSTLLSACAPPLMMFIIGTGSTASRPPARYFHSGSFFEAATACALASDTPSSALAPRRPLFSVPSRSIRRRSRPAWSAASKPVSAVAIVAVDVRDRLAHALAEVARLVAVAQLDGLLGAGGRAGRHHRAAEAAVGQRDFGFERGIAAAVEDFAGVDLWRWSVMASFDLEWSEEGGRHRPDDASAGDDSRVGDARARSGARADASPVRASRIGGAPAIRPWIRGSRCAW